MDHYVEQTREFLQRCILAEVSTISPTGEPEVATVLYFVDPDFNFYFLTRRHTRKFNNLASNNKIGMVITSAETHETVQVQGETDLALENMDVFVVEIAKRSELMEMYYGPFLKLNGLDFSVIKVKPYWLRYLNFKEGVEAYRQILPDYRLTKDA